MLHRKMEGVVIRHVGLVHGKPATRPPATAGDICLMCNHGAHPSRSFPCLLGCAEVLVEEGPHFLPAVHRLLLPIGTPIIVEEPMAGAVIAVEFIRFAVLL